MKDENKPKKERKGMNRTLENILGVLLLVVLSAGAALLMNLIFNNVFGILTLFLYVFFF